jgi:hypothetical protein
VAEFWNPTGPASARSEKRSGTISTPVGSPGSLVTERHGFLAAVPLDATAGLPQP